MNNNKGKKDNKPKRRKQAGLCFFFQPQPKKQKDGTMHQTILPKYAEVNQESLKIPCKAAPMCIQTFKNMQGLGSHLNSCKYYKEKMAKKRLVLVQSS